MHFFSIRTTDLALVTDFSGIGLTLMEEVNAESELSLRLELWGVRKSHSKIFIYVYTYVQNFVTSTLMGKYETICLKL